jgi:hypothetical protein
MMTDYRQGFKDGFALGLEEGKRNQNLNPVPLYHLDPTKSPSVLLKETCPKCGITIGGVMGYVCNSINCPTFYKTWTGPAQYNDWSAGSSGAVGSTAIDTDVPGANGPRGPSGPIDYSMR